MKFKDILDSPLCPIDIIQLRQIMKEEGSQKTRDRSHAIILLFHDHRSFEDVASIFDVHINTINNWAGRWVVEGINGVYDLDGRGVKPIFTEADEKIILECLEIDPRSLRKLDAMVMERTGKTASIETYRRIMKKHGKSWKRQRKTPKGSPTEDEYERGVSDLAELKGLAQDGEFDLVYFDASGFSLQPYIPYAWQDIGRDGTLRIPASHSMRINVFAFLNPTTQDLVAYEPIGPMTSSMLIDIMDDFCSLLTAPVVVALDNAPIHVSKAVMERRESWEKRGLTLYFIPRYSPELNLIEILWRKMKYEWLPSVAYVSMTALACAVHRILDSFGSEYRIEFVN
jgi:transposase